MQGAVRAVFELFAREGTAYAVVQRFHELGLRFPRRAYGGVWNGKLIWGRIAGTYVFGRYQSSKAIGPAGAIETRTRRMPEEEWRGVIHDHHPGYISRDQFLANRQRLAQNRTNAEVLTGPARESLCLLQGLLVCGLCGRRLTVRYTGNGGLYPVYQCNGRKHEGLARCACMSVSATPLDNAVSARVVDQRPHRGRRSGDVVFVTDPADHAGGERLPVALVLPLRARSAAISRSSWDCASVRTSSMKAGG
ncbi:hypothetical protein A9K66_24585 [Mesorhizobium sp. AA23]|nr:hypothetical protein A9K66_24585 [Mesorhizobium sp. AA23]